MKRTNYIHHLICAAACIALLLASVRLTAQTAGTPPAGETLTFTFAPGNDLFTLRGNEAQLAQLLSLVDEYRSEITAGRLPLRVDGYCASLPTQAANLRTAYLRASRVKSELIMQKGLTEAAFVTGNYTHAYLDTQKDIVVVTLRIPATPEPTPQEQPLREEPKAEVTPKPEPAADPQPGHATINGPEQAVKAEPEPAAHPAAPATSPGNAPYRFAVRTNLLYDAMLLPTLGIEWRINEHVGVRIDGSLSWWDGSGSKVQKIWLLNPEVRWYLLGDRRFYVGASGTYGEYNIYKYPLGNLLRDDTGYQGHLWNAGLTVGYQLRLCRHLSADFNLGLGYTRSEYDSFTVTDGVRVSKERDRSKNFWEPTQAGINLVWTIGGKK